MHCIRDKMNKENVNQEIKAVALSDRDTVTIENGLYKVESTTTYYNPKYYKLIPKTDNQKEILKPKQEVKKVTPKTVESELKQLTNMDRLKKKIETTNKAIETLEQAKNQGDEDKQILTTRKINKHRKTISKYLEQLKQDAQFNINKIGETCYKMAYKGQYVTATKRGNILISGVF